MNYTPVPSDNLPIDDNSGTSSEDNICRFCMETSDRDGIREMVSPCRCNGTIKYVHRSCLLQERGTKLESGTSSVDVCSACNTPYELMIKKVLPKHPFWRFVRRVLDGLVAIGKFTLAVTIFILALGLCSVFILALFYFFFFHEPVFIAYDPGRYDMFKDTPTVDINVLSTGMFGWWSGHYIIVFCAIVGIMADMMEDLGKPGRTQEEERLKFAQYRMFSTITIASVHFMEISVQCSTLVLYTMYKDEHAFLQLVFPELIMYRMTIIVIGLAGYSCYIAWLWRDEIASHEILLFILIANSKRRKGIQKHAREVPGSPNPVTC